MSENAKSRIRKCAIFVGVSVANKRILVGRSKELGGALSPPVGPGQSPGGGRGAKPPKIFVFYALKRL